MELADRRREGWSDGELDFPATVREELRELTGIQ
jgi:hypothetical protein